jgi:regulator of cell morphogenesis and NO signaling
MSHHPNITTPEGTPLPERTVGELVAERPGRSRIFQAFQIDFCCQGGRTLREACEKRSVALPSVIEQLEAEATAPAPESSNPANLPPAELASYIVTTHHDFLRRELPRLQAMADRVAHVHGGHTPSLVEVQEVFTGLRLELESHILKEEQILFPAITDMTSGRREPVALDGPIACMINEHDDAGRALERLNALTSGYTPPPEACNTYRALFAGLGDLEEDLHRHIHLENAVLFPVAKAFIEEGAAKA